MGEHPAYALRRIVGTGWTERLLVAYVDLPEPALTVAEIHRTVLLDRVDVIRGHVLLTGRLRSLYTYVAGTSSTHGPVKALNREQAFDLSLPVAGADSGMDGHLAAAHVTDAAVVITALTPRGQICALQDRSLIHLAVQVLSVETVLLQADGPGATSTTGLAPASAPASASASAPASASASALPSPGVAAPVPPNSGIFLTRFAFRRLPTG